MSKMLNLFKREKPKNESRIIYPTHEKGFHGDNYLINVTNFVLEKCDTFIETGSAEATTLRFVAKAHPRINCFSCEADQVVYEHAKKQISQFHNVDLRNEFSPNFIYKLVKERPEILKGETCFWLDAHGYGFHWPLRDEVSYILNTFSEYFIFIDDFKVSGESQFGYDIYEDQECSLEYLSDILSQVDGLNIYFPRYSEVTSSYHPLRGWVLIEKGHGDLIETAGFKNIFKHNKSLPISK